MSRPVTCRPSAVTLPGSRNWTRRARRNRGAWWTQRGGGITQRLDTIRPLLLWHCFVSAKGTSMSRRRNERRPHAYTLQRGYTGAAKVAPSAPSVNSHHQDTFLQLPGIHYTEPCRSQQMLPSTAVRTPKVVVHQQHTTIPVYL